MDVHNPRILAAELRARAAGASEDERADLLFLAAEYARMAEASERGEVVPLDVFLPK